MDRACGPCIAIRLHPLVQALNAKGIKADEKNLRNEMKKRYGKSCNGSQHFLDPSRVSPTMMRTKHYDNTKHAKCMFIPHRDINDETLELLYSGNIQWHV